MTTLGDLTVKKRGEIQIKFDKALGNLWCSLTLKDQLEVQES